MNRIITILLLLTACLNFNIAVGQQVGNQQNDLQGKMELTIDVSNMTDTVGRFMIMIGGESFYPEIKNNELNVSKLMLEPKKVFMAFYPAQHIKANPGKRLNEIAADFYNSLDFLGVPGKFKIVVNGTVGKSQIVNASPHQEKYAALLKLKGNFNLIMEKDQAPLITEINSTTDKRVRDSLIANYYKHYRQEYPKYYQDTILSFIKYNPDAPASLFELEEYSYDRNKDLNTLTFLYNNLTDRLKALPAGRRVFNLIDERSFAIDNLIGKPAPDFTQNTPLGKAVSLRDFRGNVTLLEFWASWCGPCRVSNPALVKAYQKYNDKGFRILGVSLDDDKERWLKAINDDGLVWTHVSDLKQFKNSVAVLYHISSIPSNFLIDKSGKIVASNLDEEQLDKYLEKLLK
ncbi:TlpA family protein disulfide reductase [Flavisolibacter sp. BT320]|nr:TlpA family protein disulfide reductase [Flavisolibacter longurius]